MPTNIDPKAKERCLELMLKFPNPSAAAEVIAERNGVGAETLRRLWVRFQMDGGQRRGATSEEFAEIRELKAKVRRLEEDNDILRWATVFFAGDLTPRNRQLLGSSTVVWRLVMRSIL